MFLTLTIAAHFAPPNIFHIIGATTIELFWAKDIRTPNLDRLAAEGMKFTWFHAPCPVCTPSRAAILAGCYAQRVVYRTCSFHFSREGLHSNEVTIAELFMRGF